jgi:HlyD family secretion protein
MLELFSKLISLFTRRQRRKLLVLQIAFALTAVVQVAGVASLAPFIALLSNPGVIQTNPITSYLYRTLGFGSTSEFLVAFAVVIIVFIAFTNAAGAATAWLSARFSQTLGVELQQAVYRSYISKDVTYFAQNSTSAMTSVITQDTPRFVFMVLQPALSLTSQAFVVLLIAVGLLVIDPVSALLALAAIGGSYVAIFSFIKNRLGIYSKRFQVANVAKFRLISESLGGIKEIQLFGTEAQYDAALNRVNFTTSRALASTIIFGELPRFLIETIAFCALLSVSIYLLVSGKSATQIVSVLSLYAMAGYRLLPAAQNMFKSASQMKANASALYAILPHVLDGRARKFDPPLPVGRDDTAPVESIRFSNVCFAYPGAAAPALSDVNLELPGNSLVALVGASGAGKSTLADVLLGFLRPSTGDVALGPLSLAQSPRRLWQSRLGYVPQTIFMIDDTIAANIAFGSDPHQVDMERVKRAARMAAIDEFIATLPKGYEFVVGERGAMLSGGQRQRIGLARALYRDADVLVLDEVTSALDNQNEKDVLATLRRLRKTKTIVMIAHRQSSIAASDFVVFLKDGQVSGTGTYHELMTDNDDFRRLMSATSLEDQEQAGA